MRIAAIAAAVRTTSALLLASGRFGGFGVAAGVGLGKAAPRVGCGLAELAASGGVASSAIGFVALGDPVAAGGAGLTTTIGLLAGTS
jgi:hypothetical protein